MEKKGKYQVGSDNDTSETVRTQIMGQAAQFIADVWKRHLYPNPYDRTFQVGGIKVRVQVGEDIGADALDRLRDLMGDRSADA